MPITPQTTFAIVVAIEKYERLGAEWNCLRTTGHGVRFVEWLLAEGLRPENIRFFTDPHEAAGRASVEALGRKGVVVAPPATEAIRRELVEGLPARLAAADGDCGFYFFWSGHGFSDAQTPHGMVCPESAIDLDPRVFSLQAIRRLLVREPWARLRRQAFFVNACASPFLEGERLVQVALNESSENQPSGVKQFTACAAVAGATASDRGPFCSILLDALRKAPMEEGLRDMHHAAAWIWHLHELRTREPEYAGALFPHLDLEPWNGLSSWTVKIESDDEDARIPQWKAKAGELAARLPKESRPHDHYRQCRGRHAAAQTPPLAMVEDLAELEARYGVPRILEWLARIGMELPPSHEINQWLDRIFGNDPELGTACLGALRDRLKPPQGPYHLFIEIPDADYCEVRWRVFDSNGLLCHQPEGSPAMRPSPDALRELLAQILQDAAIVRYRKDLQIELLLPRELLHLDVDQWPDPRRRAGSAATLGWDFRVALRDLHRMENPSTDAHQNWIDLANAIFACDCGLVQWTSPTMTIDDFHRRKLSQADRLCLLTGFIVDPFGDAGKAIDPRFDEALDQGLPFAIWVRNPGDATAEVRDRITATVAGSAAARRRTPDAIRDFRLNHPELIPHGLTLFWDDPERNPFLYDPETERAFRGAHLNYTDIR